jgi:hypothetical protein
MSYVGNTPADKFLTLEKQQFSVSATTNYTLSHSVSSPQDIRLVINNVPQNPNSSYTVSGTALTLSSATSSGDTMYCVFLGKAIGTIAPASSSVTQSMLDTTATNSPSFLATLSSNQAIPTGTFTKASMATEQWDIGGKYDNSTYRFTPTISGKYVFFMTGCFEASIDDAEQCSLRLYKNGSAYFISGQQKTYSPSASQTLRLSSSGIIELDGDDYIEMFVVHDEGADVNLRATESSFGAYKLIGV